MGKLISLFYFLNRSFQSIIFNSRTWNRLLKVRHWQLITGSIDGIWNHCMWGMLERTWNEWLSTRKLRLEWQLVLSPLENNYMIVATWNAALRIPELSRLNRKECSNRLLMPVMAACVICFWHPYLEDSLHKYKELTYGGRGSFVLCCSQEQI